MEEKGNSPSPTHSEWDLEAPTTEKEKAANSASTNPFGKKRGTLEDSAPNPISAGR